MDSHRFDAFARRFASTTRRQALAALVSASLLRGAGSAPEAQAACKGYNGKCKRSRSCCGADGLRCKNGRCRCQQGWQQCLPDATGCQNLLADVNHCGACGNQCQGETPCCVNGACQPRCGDTCCVDCFAELLIGGMKNPFNQVCCSAETICSPPPVKRKKGRKPKPTDPAADQCCYPDQTCVAGECCSDGILGAVVCGDRCCARAACCNGSCCPAGQVCATTSEGETCLPADRPCAGGCQAGEICAGGICCAGLRVCGDVCCSAGRYCEFQDNDSLRNCCPINQSCASTYRGRRVRR